MIVSVFLFFCLVVMAVMAESYRQQRNTAWRERDDAHKWVDEIIEALEDSNEEEGNEKIDSLVAQRTDA